MKKTLLAILFSSIIFGMFWIHFNVRITVVDDSPTYYIKYKCTTDNTMINFNSKKYSEDNISVVIDSQETNYRFKSLQLGSTTTGSYKKYHYVNYDGVAFAIVHDGIFSIFPEYIEHNNKIYKRYN